MLTEQQQLVQQRDAQKEGMKQQQQTASEQNLHTFAKKQNTRWLASFEPWGPFWSPLFGSEWALWEFFGPIRKWASHFLPFFLPCAALSKNMSQGPILGFGGSWGPFEDQWKPILGREVLSVFGSYPRM